MSDEQLELFNNNPRTQRLWKQIIHHLAKEFRITISAATSIAALYNGFLWNWMVKPFLKTTATTATRASGEIVAASVDGIRNIVGGMATYIASNPVPIATCAVAMGGPGEAKDIEKRLISDLKNIAKSAGKESIDIIAQQAETLTQEIWGQMVVPRIERILPAIGSNTIQKLALNPPSESNTEISKIIHQNGQVSVQNHLQSLDYREKRTVQPSAAQQLALKGVCAIMKSTGLGSAYLEQDCYDLEAREQSLSALEVRCPRIVEDMNIIVQDQVDDFVHKGTNAITRGVRDVNRELERTTHDTLLSAWFMGIFLILFILFYSIYRILFGGFVDRWRRRLGPGGNRQQRLRFSRRPSRKRSVRESRRRSRILSECRYGIKKSGGCKKKPGPKKSSIRKRSR